MKSRNQLFPVGYDIKTTHWNQGNTTRSNEGDSGFFHQEPQYKKSCRESFKRNLASAKVIEKLGFVYDRDGITSPVIGVRYFDSREYYLDLEI